MTYLTEDLVNDLFQDIEDRLRGGNQKPVGYLKNLYPSQGEIERLEWRYRLSGYLEGLSASGQIDSGFIEQLVAALFSRSAALEGARPGRSRPFSIDIVTEQRKVFSFDVPSINPLDAYVQLTKRTAYKAIPGIECIKVFAGLQMNRSSDAEPLRIFHSDELVFIA